MNITAEERAQLINNDFGQYNPKSEKIEYGPFNYRGAIAEIGAGQEVARLFFEARNTSNTLIKTMSAFGKGCSNAIYKETRGYISDKRLVEMISHDYNLLLGRKLEDGEKKEIEQRNQELRYFTFASTVDISVNKQGWMGVRVQIDGCSLREPVKHRAKEYRIKFEPLVSDRTHAIRIVGTLGINLIYAAILHSRHPQPTIGDEQFVRDLLNGFDPTGIRIDSIAVARYDCTEEPGAEPISRLDNSQEGQANLEGQILSSMLVKLSATKCAVFTKRSHPATPAYDMLARNRYLLIANLAGAPSGDLKALSQALHAAKKPFLDIVNQTRDLIVRPESEEELEARKPEASETDIQLAIHVPLLVAHPEKGRKAPALFSDTIQSKIARDRRRDHLDLVGAVNLEEIREIVNDVCDLNLIALISEFTPMVELVKYVTQRTRLREYYTLSTDGLWPKNDIEKLKTIGIVYRADQFVGVLLHSKSNFADRNQFELVGSLVRRLATFFIYPCAPDDILKGKSFRGAALAAAFSEEGLKKLSNRSHGPVTLETLYQCLNEAEGYLDMLKYLETTKSVSQLTIQ